MKRGAIERISDLHLFTRIVAGGSLSAAARDVGMSLAVVSTRLAALEQALGVTLVHRNSRTLRLSADGERFLDQARDVLAAVRSLEETVAPNSDSLNGHLRVTASAAFARRHIAPLIGGWQLRHPTLTIDLVATDRTVDLVGEGFDVAIRQSDLPDSTMVVRTLIPNGRVACASPAYVARSGGVAHPQELRRHRCIVMGDPPMRRWRFGRRSAEEATVVVEPAFQTNDGEVAHQAALGGAGVALKSRIDVIEDLRTGTLVDLLPDWTSPGSAIQAVFPAAVSVPQRARQFVALLEANLRQNT